MAADDQAPPAPASGRDALALAGLRHGWGEAYEIGWAGGRWHGKRRDGLGSELTADDPDALWAVLYEDYRSRPVPRDAGGQ